METDIPATSVSLFEKNCEVRFELNVKLELKLN
jgi:hypothetical protein